MEENKVYYTRSNGEKVDISTMNTEHLINALSKSYRETFSSTNHEEFSEYITKISQLKDEIHKRINTFGEGLD